MAVGRAVWTVRAAENLTCSFSPFFILPSWSNCRAEGKMKPADMHVAGGVDVGLSVMC